MRKEAEEIKRIFYTVPDVKKVELIGVQPEKIYLEVSNDKLSQLGISLDTLASAIKSQSAVVPAGMAESTDNNVYLRLTGLPDTLKEIGSIPVNANGAFSALMTLPKSPAVMPTLPNPKFILTDSLPSAFPFPWKTAATISASAKTLPKP